MLRPAWRRWRRLALPLGVAARCTPRHVGSSFLVTRVPQLCEEEDPRDPRVSVGDVLAFLHSEIIGTAANSPVDEVERMHMMAQADLNPDDKIRLEDAEEMLEELGVSRRRLVSFLQDGGASEEDE
mmetsp:Transcript_60274/g.132019  ORF Transcript_60274/g.132019 Transcript_60274/m.132019 type:complete len:126 (+) Transcript_60274:12-389(+)